MTTHAGEADDDRASRRVSVKSQSYPALVWRRFRRSIPGMLGLVLVSILLIGALFADFFSPMDPNAGRPPHSHRLTGSPLSPRTAFRCGQ